jgi:DNA-directed RNA polymerase subunit E'
MVESFSQTEIVCIWLKNHKIGFNHAYANGTTSLLLFGLVGYRILFAFGTSTQGFQRLITHPYQKFLCELSSEALNIILPPNLHMFYLTRIEESVRIDPLKLRSPLKEAVLDTLREKYAGTYDKELGYVVTIVDAVEMDDEGYLIPGDGGVKVRVVADALSFIPYPNDMVEGIVDEITESGARVRVGPMTGILHISQVFDGDYAVYDPKRGALIGKNTQRTLQINDLIRVRITSISSKAEAKETRLMLTCRQPGLGKPEWVKQQQSQQQQKTK